MSDRIVIEGVEFHGYHGVTPAEREVGHRFRVDLTLEMDLAPAGRSDDLQRTVDYSAVARAAFRAGTGASVQLVEAVAQRVADAVLGEFALVDAVTVRLSKLHPPVDLLFDRSTVEIRRTRRPAADGE